MTLACVFDAAWPKNTCAPARSSVRAHAMLLASSKRALISIDTATCLPFSAACTSARTTSEFEPARYSVILIASTCGSVGGAADEVEHRRKRVVGVVQQQIALPDERERIGFVGKLGDARHERRIAQVRPRQRRDRHQRPQPQRRRRRVDVFIVDLQLLEQLAADAIGDADVDLQPHARAEPAPAHLAVDDRQQVVRLLLQDVDVHVARDAERVAAEDLHAREQIVEVRGDQLLERQEVGGRRRGGPVGGRRRIPKLANGTKRGRLSGTLTRAKRRSLVSGSRASTASDSDRFERNGNGWPGSTASGVSTGNTARRKYWRAARLVSPSRLFQSRMWMPVLGERRDQIIGEQLRRRIRAAGARSDRCASAARAG